MVRTTVGCIKHLRSMYRNRFGHVDAGHRCIEIDLDMSMRGIDVSKSIWTCRCGASMYRNRFGHVEVGYRCIEIDLDMSKWVIDVSKSIWTCRSGASMHRNRFGHVEVGYRCIEIDLDMSKRPIDVSKPGILLLDSSEKYFSTANAFFFYNSSRSHLSEISFFLAGFFNSNDLYGMTRN